jgi:hypothetical protein
LIADSTQLSGVAVDALDHVYWGVPYNQGGGLQYGVYEMGGGEAPARIADFIRAWGMVSDAAGNVYVTSDQLDAVFRIHSEIACADGLDADGDGLIDYPDDPGCDSTFDTDEHSAALPCDDGLDSDGDGLVDYPADPGCATPTDLLETSDAVCDDGIDADGDGLVDYGEDPGCLTLFDLAETAASLPCDDGIDNDGDGLIDFPADPECQSALHASEHGVIPRVPGLSGTAGLLLATLLVVASVRVRRLADVARS